MPVKNLPYLFVGDSNDASNLDISIKCVVNCTKNLPFSNVNLENHRIPIDDDGNETTLIKDYWTNELFDKISDHLAHQRCVLVHCNMGRQRSCATVAAYIMKTQRLSLEEAIAFVKSKKRDAFFPEVNFFCALQTLRQDT
jgi:protein-tyrosine phosphatase